MKIARLLASSALALTLAACAGESTLVTDSEDALALSMDELSPHTTTIQQWTQEQVDFGPGPCSGEDIEIFSTMSFRFKMVEYKDGSIKVRVDQSGTTSFTDAGKNFQGTWVGSQDFKYKANSGQVSDISNHLMSAVAADGTRATITISLKYIFKRVEKPVVEIASIVGTCG